MSEHAPEEQLLWDLFAKPPRPAHILIGSVCTCGEWSAGCGHNVSGSWAQHVALAARSVDTKEQTDEH